MFNYLIKKWKRRQQHSRSLSVETLDGSREFEASGILYKELAKCVPNNPHVFSNWSTILSDRALKGGSRSQDYFERSCAMFEKAIKLNPQDSDTYFKWGLALLGWFNLQGNKGSTDLLREACDKFQKAHTIAPKDWEVAYAYGTMILNVAYCESKRDAGQYQMAVQCLETAVALRPNDYESLIACGIALLNLILTDESAASEQLYIEAQVFLRKAMKLKPRRPESCCNYGVLLLSWADFLAEKERPGKMREAESYLLKSESIQTGIAAYNLAYLYAILGDIDKSREWLMIIGNCQVILDSSI